MSAAGPLSNRACLRISCADRPGVVALSPGCHPPHASPFHHVPASPGTKAQAEAAALELVQGMADLIVLARDMQVLSAGFLARFGGPVINIHHSFLPASSGADPYAQAHARGVGLIGATAHDVTAELDAGPVIEQDVHGWDTATLWRTWCASVVTSSARCWRVRWPGTWRTGCWCTAT